MRYRVVYYLGEEINVRTPIEAGNLMWEGDRLRIKGTRSTVEVLFSALREVELFRMQGLGRMIRVDFGDQRLFVTVVRFNLGSFFAVVNFFKTGELSARLESVAAK